MFKSSCFLLHRILSLSVCLRILERKGKLFCVNLLPITDTLYVKHMYNVLQVAKEHGMG